MQDLFRIFISFIELTVFFLAAPKFFCLWVAFPLFAKNPNKIGLALELRSVWLVVCVNSFPVKFSIFFHGARRWQALHVASWVKESQLGTERWIFFIYRGNLLEKNIVSFLCWLYTHRYPVCLRFILGTQSSCVLLAAHVEVVSIVPSKTAYL